MKIINTYRTIVIGTGCAGYGAADCLYDKGITDIAILSDNRVAGTSRNAGSDKQTFYKMSLSGDEGDCPIKMAQTLFEGGAMDGDTALVEATTSVKAFMKLEGLGVSFPQNDYGEFVGYKTDHDPYSRASSVGPYTSKEMTEAFSVIFCIPAHILYQNFIGRDPYGYSHHGTALQGSDLRGRRTAAGLRVRRGD